MADNYLEKHREDYELRKAAYERKKRHLPKLTRDLSSLNNDKDGL